MALFLFSFCAIIAATSIINQEQDRQVNAQNPPAVPRPPTLVIQSATDMNGYNIPYNKLLYHPPQCNPGSAPDCVFKMLHGRMKFTISLQNNYNPIDHLECRLDGKYAFQANEAYGPCDYNGNLNRKGIKYASTLYVPYMTWSHVINLDGTPYQHIFTIMAVDVYGQHSNVANWKWRTTNRAID
jgi:hypothetical protein